MPFDITLFITFCGQINDLGDEVKMMELVFVSFVSTEMTENYRGTKWRPVTDHRIF